MSTTQQTLTAKEAVALVEQHCVEDVRAEAALIIRHGVDPEEYITATIEHHDLGLDDEWPDDFRRAYGRQVEAAKGGKDVATSANVW